MVEEMMAAVVVEGVVEVDLRCRLVMDLFEICSFSILVHYFCVLDVTV